MTPTLHSHMLSHDIEFPSLSSIMWMYPGAFKFSKIIRPCWGLRLRYIATDMLMHACASDISNCVLNLTYLSSLCPCQATDHCFWRCVLWKHHLIPFDMKVYKTNNEPALHHIASHCHLCGLSFIRFVGGKADGEITLLSCLNDV